MSGPPLNTPRYFITPPPPSLVRENRCYYDLRLRSLRSIVFRNLLPPPPFFIFFYLHTGVLKIEKKERRRSYYVTLREPGFDASAPPFSTPVVVQLLRFVNEARTDRFLDNYICLFLPRKQEERISVNVSLSLSLSIDRSKKSNSYSSPPDKGRGGGGGVQRTESAGPKFAFKKAGPRARR